MGYLLHAATAQLEIQHDDFDWSSNYATHKKVFNQYSYS